MPLSSRSLVLAGVLAALPGCGSCLDRQEEKPAPIQNTGRLQPLGSERVVQLDPTGRPSQMVMSDSSASDQ